MSALIKADRGFEQSAYNSNRSEQVKGYSTNGPSVIKESGSKYREPPQSPAEKMTKLRPTITFAKVPTKKAAPIKKLDMKITSPDKYLETESFQVNRFDHIDYQCILFI